MEWYYARDRKQQGPIGEAELRQLIRSGGVGPDDLVWHPDLGAEWVAAGTLTDRFPDVALGPAVDAGPAVRSRPRGPGGEGLTPNHELMLMARESLQGQWGLGAGVTALYWLVASAANLVPVIGSLAGWIISGPLALGYAIVFLVVARRARPEVGQLFDGFRYFTVALAAYFLMLVFVLLWLLLLIIPGIMAAYSYIMTYYIIADEPSISPFEAIRRSQAMMRGRRWKCFCLQCRFIGWVLLCMLTLGIGFLWLMPYMQTALALFYEDVRGASDD